LPQLNDFINCLLNLRIFVDFRLRHELSIKKRMLYAIVEQIWTHLPTLVSVRWHAPRCARPDAPGAGFGSSGILTG
jgi:hypothetical protein